MQIGSEGTPEFASPDGGHCALAGHIGIALGLEDIDEVFLVLPLATLALLGQQMLETTGQDHVDAFVDLLLGDLGVVAPIRPVG